VYRNRFGTTSSDAHETLELGEFDELEAFGNFVLTIKKSDEYKVEMSGEEYEFENVDIVNENGQLRINNKVRSFRNLRNEFPDLSIVVLTPDLESIHISGKIDTEMDEFEASDLFISLDGNSKLRLNGEFEELEGKMEGMTELDVSGQAEKIKFQISGASMLKAYELKSRDVEISTRGASKAEVYASDFLDANADGISLIKYRGRPETDLKEGRSATIRRD
jgi:hypothetical protein